MDNLVTDLSPRLTGRAIANRAADYIVNEQIPVLHRQDHKIMLINICRANKGNTIVPMDPGVYSFLRGASLDPYI